MTFLLADEQKLCCHSLFQYKISHHCADRSDNIHSIRLLHLSVAQKRAYRLADNKIAENGGWNEDLLRLEIAELETLCNDFDISITGFEELELDVLMNPDIKSADPKINTVPFIPENEIISRPGDVWLLGKHRIICGNSLEKSNFDKLFGTQKAAMVLQDPPYNVKITGNVCGTGKFQHKEFAFASGEMSAAEFVNFLKTNFKLCSQYSSQGSLHYNFMDWRHMSEILQAGDSTFSDFINMCVWVKSSGGKGSLYRSQHELCFIFKNGSVKHVNNVELGKNGRYRTNVWQYAGVNSFGRHKQDLKFHPTVKPVEMLKDAILDVSKRGDIILDSFLGSGSTLIAAEQTGRICFGLEYEPMYVDTVIRRYREIFGQDAILESTGKFYSELLKERKEMPDAA